MGTANFFASNIPLFAICVVMIFIAIRNFEFRKKESLFIISISLLIILLSAIVYFESYFANAGNKVAATVFTSLGYMFRPFLLSLFVLFANIDSKHKKRFYFIYFGSLLLNLIVYIFPFFFGVEALEKLVFYYVLKDGVAVFTRGTVLNFTSHAISFGYLVVLACSSIMRFQGKHRRDGIVVLLCVLIILSTVITEVIMSRTDLLNIVSGICVMINYIFIISINSSRDPLTHLYDRRTYYEDISKYRNQINGVVQIDMNELKYLNDNFGHNEGDTALNTLASIFEKNINHRNMCVYRLSGDEFLILMFQGKKEDLDEAVLRIKNEVNETKYSIAMGPYFIDKKEKNISFDEANKLAEEKMYEDKSNYYVTSGRDRRGKK